MVEEELSEDFKDGVLAVLELLKTEPPVTPVRSEGTGIFVRGMKMPQNCLKCPLRLDFQNRMKQKRKNPLAKSYR